MRHRKGLRSYRLRSSEDTLRADDQYQDQDGEADRDLPAEVDVERGPLDDQPEDDSAGKRAEGVSDATEDHRREDRQEQLEPELRLHVGHRACEHTRKAGKPTREYPGVEHYPRRVDAGRLCQVEVICER